MATPSRAELETQLQNLAELWDETRKFASVNTTGGTNNWVALEDAYIQAAEGDFQDQVLATLAAVRSNLSTMRDGFAGALYWHLREWGRFLDVPEEDLDGLLDQLVRDFIANAKSVKTRGFTRGTPTADGSNTGDGTLQRLSTDRYGQAMEGGRAEAWTAECVADANSGSSQRGQERFRFRSADRARDALEILGTGLQIEIAATHSRDSLLLNPSFDAFSGTATSPTAIISWSSSVAVQSSNFTFYSTADRIYLPAANATTTVYGLAVRSSCTIAQRLDVSRRALDRDRPYYLQIAWNRDEGAFSGSLTIRMGNTSASVAITNQAGWQVLRVAAGQGSWFDQFNANTMDIRAIVSRNAGWILLDDWIFTEWNPIGGTYYVLAPGRTPFLAGSTSLQRGDLFTWTDTATEAIIQRFIAENTDGWYLPHSSSPSIADP